jgi:hypothetical protein
LTNYWIFQATPDIFDLRNALKNDALKTFAVRSHKDKIQKGDKAIIWLTGESTGCYALCEIISEVSVIEVSIHEKKYFLKWNKEALQDRVELRVEYNLWNNPIYKDELNSLTTQSLKTNIPGTNFNATKKQYNIFIEHLQMRNSVEEPISKYNKTGKVTHHPLNQILFGPPGTGKTYQTINYALSIIEDKPLTELAKEPRATLHRRFEEYKAKGQVQTVTFHQSFTYEDFIEGIKPFTTEDKQVYYDIENGIFKQIALRATKNQWSNQEVLIPDTILNKADFYKISLRNDNEQSEDQGVFEYCVKNNCIALGWGDQIDFTESETERDIKERFQIAKRKPDFGVTAIKYLKLNMQKGDVVFVSKGNNTLAAIGVIDGDYYFDKNAPIAFSQFRKVNWLYTDLNISVKDFYQKSFSQMAIYQLNKKQLNLSYFQKRKAGTSENNRFVLVIDEINRGNVSAIFGELITLIETDKRKGEKEAVQLQLPYSKLNFSVPNNLFLIGTMNTADRSAEALDNALRRRFNFIELAPEPKLLHKIGQIDLAELLTAINTRIEILLNKDYQIGHAYFMKVKTVFDLQQVFENKLIPQLQEYFYGDWGKIGLILGKAFVRSKYMDDSYRKLFADFSYDARDEYEGQVIYEITDSMSWDEVAFVKIYEV